MLMATGAGYLGYQTYKKKEEMDKEEELCYQYCYPQNWDAYKNGEIEKPTYRDETEMGKGFIAEGGDPKALCTKTNLAAAGLMEDRTQCDNYCPAVCDTDWFDAAEAAAGDVFENAKNMAKNLPVIGPLIEALEQYAPYIIAVIVLIVVFKIVSMLGLFNRRRRNNNNNN